MLGEEGEPAVVVELRMAHHQDINPANLATPQERRQDHLAGIKVLAGKATTVNDHHL